MRRREFITLLGGAAAAWPLAARAQQADRMRRIGVLMGLAEDDPDTKAGLRDSGRGSKGLDGPRAAMSASTIALRPAGAQAQALAKELVALQPDVILANTTPSTAALQRETRTIPIVFVSVSDPIGSGFVASLARPGGNITGLLLFEASITGKWLAMLKEIAPRLSRAALVANPKTTPLRPLPAVGQGCGAVARDRAGAQSGRDMPPTSSAPSSPLRAMPNGGLVVPPDTTTIVHRDLIIALAARHRLPAVYPFRFFVAAGGLMSYGTDLVDQFDRRRPMSTASCAALSPPTFRCRRRPSTKQSST